MRHLLFTISTLLLGGSFAVANEPSPDAARARLILAIPAVPTEFQETYARWVEEVAIDAERARNLEQALDLGAQGSIVRVLRNWGLPYSADDVNETVYFSRTEYPDRPSELEHFETYMGARWTTTRNDLEPGSGQFMSTLDHDPAIVAIPVESDEAWDTPAENQVVDTVRFLVDGGEIFGSVIFNLLIDQQVQCPQYIARVPGQKYRCMRYKLGGRFTFPF